MKNAAIALLLGFCLAAVGCHAQTRPLSINAISEGKTTANNTIPSYNSAFGYGTNMGYYPPHSDEQIAEFASRLGINTLRPALFEHFVEKWGYDMRLEAFRQYEKLGMRDLVCFIGYPSDAHRDKTVYCGKDTSTLFANLYEPIWQADGSVNPHNFYANYVFKTVKTYGRWVKFWEIWNEPDFATTYKTEMAPGLPGAWWNTNPDPCEYTLHAPVQHYIRMLRVSYEVIKSVDSTAFVAIGGIGFPSFLDVILRQTDNPDGGRETPQYPNGGGAYFDVVSFHSYPHIDNSVREWSDKLVGFQYFRHSDRAVEGIFKRKNALQDVLKKHGYDGSKFPQKPFMITESNIPAAERDVFMGSYEAQRNFILKALVKSQMNGVLQFHPYSIGELKTVKYMRNEFDVMGLFHPLEGIKPDAAEPTESGIAYRTTVELLKNHRFDAAETRRLNLPPEADGAAFRDTTTGDVVYCLWAKTTVDKSENAAATFSFAPLSIGSVQQYIWDFWQTKTVATLDGKAVRLTGAPAFFRKIILKKGR